MSGHQGILQIAIVEENAYGGYEDLKTRAVTRTGGIGPWDATEILQDHEDGGHSNLKTWAVGYKLYSSKM